MIIFSKTTITDFGLEHADSLSPLLEWYKITRQANFKMINSVNTHDEFVDAINFIDKYVDKVNDGGGFKALSKIENDDYGRIALLISDYEDSIPVFPPEPNMTYEKLILIYMMHKRFKVAETANRLDILESELLEILAGEKPVDYQMSQKLRDVLGVKAEYLLQAA